MVSRAVARKRRGVSRRWPNITQRSLFRAGGEAGARNRNDLEQHRAGPPCSSEPCPPRHFRLSTTSFPFRFSIAHELASRRIAGFYYGHAGRSTSREVLPPFLSTFSNRGQESPGSCLVNRCTWEPTRAVRLSCTTFHFLFSLSLVANSFPLPPLSSPLNRMGKFSLLVSEGKSKKKKIYIYLYNFLWNNKISRTNRTFYAPKKNFFRILRASFFHANRWPHWT